MSHFIKVTFITQLNSGIELASIVVNITNDASSLESSAIAVIGDIIDNLTNAAIEDPQVTTAVVVAGVKHFSICRSVMPFSALLTMYWVLTPMSY